MPKTVLEVGMFVGTDGGWRLPKAVVGAGAVIFPKIEGGEISKPVLICTAGGVLKGSVGCVVEVEPAANTEVEGVPPKAVDDPKIECVDVTIGEGLGVEVEPKTLPNTDPEGAEEVDGCPKMEDVVGDVVGVPNMEDLRLIIAWWYRA